MRKGSLGVAKDKTNGIGVARVGVATTADEINGSCTVGSATAAACGGAAAAPKSAAACGGAAAAPKSAACA
jgi:hypothetical protein